MSGNKSPGYADVSRGATGSTISKKDDMVFARL